MCSININENSRRYKVGEPVNVSEYGGIALSDSLEADKEIHLEGEDAVQSETAWGYGKGENDGEIFLQRYRDLTELILSYPNISGYCYTQLYDVEQEQNGFYTYDRKNKLTKEQKQKIKEIQSKR